MKVPLFVLFSEHFPFFLRVASDKGKENVFTHLLDIWDLGFLWNSSEGFAFCGVLSPPGLRVSAGSQSLTPA